VTLGASYERDDAIVVPISWRSSTLSGLFPVFDGNLEVTPLDEHHCRVGLIASYLPPLGELGRQLDQVLLHRIADSTALAFLDRVADSLESNPPVKDLRPGWS
jgi:hypothetical protein